MTTHWMAKRLEFFLFHAIQTSYGAHLASYPMGILMVTNILISGCLHLGLEDCCIEMRLHCCRGVTLTATYMVPYCKAPISIQSDTIHEGKNVPCKTDKGIQYV
jgi:hypothetical protein